MASKYEGERFGMLTAVESVTVYTAGGRAKQKFRFQCDCGGVLVRPLSFAINSAAPMCPKCRASSNAEKSANGHKHPLYPIWRGILARCLVATNPAYGWYGARGIKVCERWRGSVDMNGNMAGFKNFLADMGGRPSAAHSIGRIDNDGPYSPENCRWETPAEQMSNTRANVNVTVRGETKTVSEWGRVFGTGGMWAAQAKKYGIPLHIAAEKCFCAAPQRRWDWKALFGIPHENHNKLRGTARPITEEELAELNALFDGT